MKIKLLLSIFLFTYHLQAQIDYFPPLSGDEWETLSVESLDWCSEEVEPFYDFLEDGGTKAFILLKDGKIVLEKYFGTTTMDSNLPWNSAGKTITALMVGVAQENGLLAIEDPSSDYLGEGWTSLTQEQEDLITIRHQLTMTSGLDDSQGFCTDPECLTYLADPGTRWAYHNAPYTLLTEVIANASGLTMNNFVNLNLKAKTGIIGAYIPIDYNRIFFGQPRGMARMGLLMLNQGTWDDTPVLSDMEYYNQMVSPSQDLNESYGYLWWLNGSESFMLPSSQIVFTGPLSPNAPSDGFSGIGKNGQFLDIIPSENIVVVRMGDAPNDDLAPIFFHDEMWEQLSSIICTTTSVGATDLDNKIEIFPNPFDEQFFIQTDLAINNLRLFNSAGQLILQQNNANTVSAEDLSSGLYWLEINLENGARKIEKLIKR